MTNQNTQTSSKVSNEFINRKMKKKKSVYESGSDIPVAGMAKPGSKAPNVTLTPYTYDPENPKRPKPGETKKLESKPARKRSAR